MSRSAWWWGPDLGKGCVIDTCRVQEREQDGYDVACVATNEHVCLFKSYEMYRTPKAQAG